MLLSGSYARTLRRQGDDRKEDAALTAEVDRHASDVRRAVTNATMTERERWQKFLPDDRHDDGIIWLHPVQELKRIVEALPGGVPRYVASGCGPDAWTNYRPMRVEFEAVPMAYSLMNGKQIRWMNWKPVRAEPQELRRW